MRSSIAAAFFFSSVLMFRSLAWGNAVPEVPLEEKSRRSDLVVIASVSSIAADGCLRYSRCAHLQISSFLKGAPREAVVVAFDGPIAEQNPKCCAVGATYLLFLRRVKDNIFEAVNGPFGIYPVATGVTRGE